MNVCVQICRYSFCLRSIVRLSSFTTCISSVVVPFQRPGAAGQVRAAGTAVHKTIGAVNTLSGTTVGRQLPVNSPDLLKQKLQVSQRPQVHCPLLLFQVPIYFLCYVLAPHVR